MLRTNRKKVKERVRLYLMENVYTLLRDREIETNTPVTECMEIVNQEARWNKNLSEFEVLEHWLQGLSGFGADIYVRGGKVEYGYSKAKEIIAYWLNQTPKETSKYSERETEKLMLNLCYRELKAMEVFELKKGKAFYTKEYVKENTLFSEL